MAVDSSIYHCSLQGIDVVLGLVIDDTWEALFKTQQGGAFLLVLHCFVVAMTHLLITSYRVFDTVVSLGIGMIFVVL